MHHRNSMRVGVIASMKKGLEHFIYRELLLFAAQGCSLSLFPTKYQLGLYNARAEWALHRWHPVVVMLWQPYFFLKAPLRYLRILRQAVSTRALVDFALAWYFARHMTDVDVIYATFADHKLFIGYFCKLIVQKPLAVTIHAYELYLNPNPRLFLTALAACDQIITVTEYNKELLTTQYCIDPSKIEVVRYSVDIKDYQPAKKFIVLIVAFFTERKGHDVLFKAVKQIPYNDIEVWVVGDEGTESVVDVRGLATKLGVDSQVAFFGKLGGNALKAVYRACDVFCLPCRVDSAGVAEGFPNVLIEAMALGKPVVTTRHVEIPRIIDEIVVDENDVQGLAQAIQKVYESTPLRHRLGAKNRKLAEEYFSSRNADRTVKILRSLGEQYEKSDVPGSSAHDRTDYAGKHMQGPQR
jgi:colanic acid/amylovoran biosynthesis glycosyltransferase